MGVLKILLVDDREDEYILIRDMLSVARYLDFSLSWAASYQDGLAFIQQNSYDVYLIDYRLDNTHTGLDLIQEAVKLECRKPLILITGEGSREIDLAAMKAGASDYLDKTEITPRSLERVIRYAVEHSTTLNLLREEQEYTERITTMLPDWLYVHDLHEERIVHLHPPPETSMGYTLQEILALGNSAFLQLMHPEDAATHLDYLAQVATLKDNEVLIGQARFKKKNGDWVWFQTRNTVFARSADGLPRQILGLGQDITPQKLAEEAQRQSEERYRTALTMISDFATSVQIEADGSQTREWIADSSLLMFGYSAEEMHTKTLGSLIHPEDQPQAQADWAKNLNGQNTVGEYRVVTKSGDVLWSRIYRLPEWDAQRNRVVRIYGLLQDITERKRIELAERDQRLMAEALRDNAEALSNPAHFEEALERVLTNIRRVIPHDGADMVMIEDDEGRVAQTKDYTAHPLEKSLMNFRFKLRGISSYQHMISTGQPLIIADVASYAPWVSLPQTSWIRSCVGFPISLEGQVVAFVNLNSLTPHFFDTGVIERLKPFLHQITIALQNARAHQQAQELAALNERQRLSRDLHDSLSQTLFALRLTAETLPRVTQGIPDDVAALLKEIQALTQQAYAEMRSLLLEVRPKALDETPIQALLEQLVETFSTRSPVRMIKHIDAALELDTETKIAFYRIAQEALNNVLKHAAASEVSVRLSREGEQVRLSVRDNGQGFTSEQNANHYGLKIMRERAEAVGARLDMVSVPGEGTHITLIAPS